MTPPYSRGFGTAAWFLPAALIGLAALVSHGVVAGAPSRERTANPPAVLSALSQRPNLAFGFRSLLADVSWLQAVQVAGNRKLTRGDFDRLADLLDTVTRFDARFLVPYLLGGIVLGESPYHAGRALALLDRGEERFPLEWQLPFYRSYIHYFVLEDPREGGAALMHASGIPGSPAYFPLLASRMLSEGNRPETALAFLENMVTQETDPRRKASLEERIRAVVVERDLQLLENAVSEYASTFGSRPGGLSDLVRAGLLAQVPREPNGGKYLLTADGRIVSDRAPGKRLKVLKR